MTFNNSYKPNLFFILILFALLKREKEKVIECVSNFEKYFYSSLKNNRLNVFAYYCTFMILIEDEDDISRFVFTW